jgi:hypothetical protein
MPSSPRVRFTRQRAANAFGDPGRLVGGKGRKRKRKAKAKPPRHRFIYWGPAGVTLCSCSKWSLPNVPRAEGAWRQHAGKRA